MYIPPEGLLLVWLPPVAITMYCRPSIMYVAGVAKPEKGSVVSHSNSPV
jgi:hypothetical protein